MGEWSKALAIAPAVSVTFWQSLAKRAADEARGKGEEDEALPLLVATGDVDSAITLCTERMQFPEAICLAKSYSNLNVEGDSALIVSAAEKKNAIILPLEPCLGPSTQHEGAEGGEGGEGGAGKFALVPVDGNGNGNGSGNMSNSLRSSASSLSASASSISSSSSSMTSSVSSILNLTTTTTSDAAGQLGKRYVESGQPILAACCFLATNRADKAVRCLEKAGESELASTVAMLMKVPYAEHTHVMLAMRCERLGFWDDALAILLQRVSSSCSAEQKMGLCARFAASHSAEQANEFYKRAGLRTIADYASCVTAGPAAPFAENSKATPLATYTTSNSMALQRLTKELGAQIAPLAAAVLGQQHSLAVQIALGILRSETAEAEWEPTFLSSVVFWASCADVSSVAPELRNELLSYASYLGCVVASWRALTPVIAHLFNYTSTFIQRHSVEFTIPRDFRRLQAAIFTLVTASSKAKEQLLHIVDAKEGTVPTLAPLSGDASSSSSSSIPLEAGQKLAQESITPIRTQAQLILEHVSEYPHPGIDTKNCSVPLGSCIPSGGAVNAPVISHFTKQPINGPPFALEDGASFLSLGEALMWAQVNPFSPLSTGKRINPF